MQEIIRWVINKKWVFNLKEITDGKYRNKERLVAMDCNQKLGVYLFRMAKETVSSKKQKIRYKTKGKTK